MFERIHSFFARGPQSSGLVDPDLVRTAIERVLDGVDPRLRTVPHHERLLWRPVESALAYIAEQVQRLPPAIPFDRRRFATDPWLRALFVGPKQLLEVLSLDPDLRSYLAHHIGSPSSDVFGVLRLKRIEKTVFGTALEGDRLLRDVAQTAVSFHSHRVSLPSASEAEARERLRERALDALIGLARQHLVGMRMRRQQLEQQEHRLIFDRTRNAKVSRQGLGTQPDAPAPLSLGDSGDARQLRRIQVEIAGLRAISATLAAQLSQVAAILAEPETHMCVDRISITLDQMNIRVSPSRTGSAATLTFDEARIGAREGLIIALIRFPRDQLLQPYLPGTAIGPGPPCPWA